MLRTHRFILLVLALALVVSGCDLTESSDSATRATDGVVVANSGDFSARDGSLSVYDPSDATVGLNDIEVAFIHSIAVRNDRIYVVDNASTASGRITIFDRETFAPIGQLQSTRAPRYVAEVSNRKLYATNITYDETFSLVESTVSVFNLDTGALVDSIAVGRGPEGIAVLGDRAFVANSGGTTLSVIDTASDAATATLELGCTAPNEVFVDGEAEIVVVCQGTRDTPAEVVFVDPRQLQIRERLVLDTPVGSANGTQAAFYSPATEELYATEASTYSPVDFAFTPGTTIYRINTDANVRDATFQIPEDPSLTAMTAIGYDATNEALHVGRLPIGPGGGPSFQARGQTVVLDRSGALLDQYTVGVTPGHIDLLQSSQ
mgnify:FL=1